MENFVPVAAKFFNRTVCEEDETCLVISPKSRDRPGTVNLKKSVEIMKGMTKTGLSSVMKTVPADKVHLYQAIPAKVFVILCHNQMIVNELASFGIDSSSATGENYTNSFVLNHKNIARLQDASFVEGDSEIYCMTYGKMTKILGRINVDLGFRKTRGQNLENARIPVATHFVLLDPWFPSIDFLMFMAAYETIFSYGCLVPRLVYLSQGPNISTKCTVLAVPGNSQIEETGSVSHVRGSDNISSAEFINSAFSALLKLRSNQKIYVIVPDAKVQAQIQAKIESSFLSIDKLDLNFILLHAIVDSEIKIPDEVLVFPLVRTDTGYCYMTEIMKNCVVSRFGSYINSDSEPVSVRIISKSNHQTSKTAIYRLQAPTIVQLQDEFTKYISLTAMTLGACRLALNSIQPTRSFFDGVTNAMEHKYIYTSGIGAEMKITSITAEGIFAASREINPSTVKFLQAWQKTPYPFFAAFCVAGLLEESENLLIAHRERLAEIAKDYSYKDPFVHQMNLIVEYVKKYGIVLVDILSIKDMCSSFGADPKVLLKIMLKIITLRNSKIIGDMRYGPFETENLVHIITENELFPIATAGTNGFYIIKNAGNEVEYELSGIYEKVSDVLIIKNDVLRTRQTGTSHSNVLLYAAI